METITGDTLLTVNLFEAIGVALGLLLLVLTVAFGFTRFLLNRLNTMMGHVIALMNTVSRVEVTANQRYATHEELAIVERRMELASRDLDTRLTRGVQELKADLKREVQEIRDMLQRHWKSLDDQ